MKSTKIVSLLLYCSVLVAAVLLVGGCGHEDKQNSVTIGAILPLTGSSADAAEHAKRGIELALHDLNASRIPGQPVLKVEYGDSKNMAKDGLSVYNKMLSLDNLRFFIAHNSGVVVPLSEAVGNRSDVVLMVTISSAPGITKRGQNIFRVFVTAENEARTMSRYLSQKKNIVTAGVFYINDDFGVSGMREFEAAFPKWGGRVLWKESWEKGGADFRSSLQKLPKNCGALYIVGYEAGLGIAVKQAREVGFRGVICTTVGMSVPPWRAAAGAAADGVYYTSTGFSTAQPDSSAAKFVRDFKTLFGKESNSFAAFAYDSMTLLGRAIQETGGGDPSVVAKKMAAAGEREGVLGPIKFDASREADLPLRVWVFSDGKEVPAE